jgi:two-component system sensor histidine kinase KdpD
MLFQRGARPWSPLRAEVRPWVWSCSIVACVTLLAHLARPLLDLANISLIYLLGVLLCASAAGRSAAIVGALLSFLAYNFFLVPPLYTLHVAHSQDMVQLLLFLLTALLGGGLAARLRDRAALAQHQASELEALYNLSQGISAQVDFAAIAPLITTTACAILQTTTAAILIRDATGAEQCVARSTTSLADAPRAELTVPLLIDHVRQGVLCVTAPPAQITALAAQRRLIDLLAHQASLALERSHLARAAAQAEALAESDRMKSMMITTISHDFRTPLAAISAAAEELQSTDVSWSPLAHQQFAEVIGAEAARLTTLVTNLLDLTRLEAGALHLQQGWYDPAEILTRVLDRLAHDLRDRRLDLDLPADLPLIPVDYIHLEQILWNILQNALKYSPPGSPLDVAARVATPWLEISIGDQGPGIALEERSRVVEKFYRSPRTAAAVPGAGIGLAICQGLILAHSGELHLTDRPGGGLLVRVCLPLDLPPTR